MFTTLYEADRLLIYQKIYIEALETHVSFLSNNLYPKDKSSYLKMVKAREDLIEYKKSIEHKCKTCNGVGMVSESSQDYICQDCKGTGYVQYKIRMS